MLCRTLLRHVVGAGLYQIRDSSRVLTNSTVVQWRCISSDVDKIFPVILNPPSDHAPYTLSKEQEDLITKGDPNLVIHLNELMLKLFIRKEQGHDLPYELRFDDFIGMLGQGHAQQSKYLVYLLKRCTHKKNQAKKRGTSKEELEEILQRRFEKESKAEHPWLGYHLHRNNLFPRIHKGSMQSFYNAYVAKGLQFGQQVVIDCAFEEYMDEKQLKHTAKQILYSHVHNRKDRRPFGLHLCNFNKDGRVSYYLSKFHPQFHTEMPILSHSESYLDLFERQKLVYLTPHTTQTLQYDPDDIFILGGIVDKDLGLDLTGKKAVKEDIRYACLPLDRHVKWKLGSKLLCIHHCFNILLDVKNTGDWKKALLQNVPERKISKEKVSVRKIHSARN